MQKWAGEERESIANCQKIKNDMTFEDLELYGREKKGEKKKTEDWVVLRQ